jgi:hypothetical protein
MRTSLRPGHDPFCPLRGRLSITVRGPELTKGTYFMAEFGYPAAERI